MIERAGAPVIDRMARLAILLASGTQELASVYVLVAFKAQLGRLREIGNNLRVRCRGRCSEILTRRLVTSRTGHRLVGAFQREFRGRMLEGLQFFPLAHVVARFARHRRNLRRIVRIRMACDAILTSEMILPRSVIACVGSFRAGHWTRNRRD